MLGKTCLRKVPRYSFSLPLSLSSLRHTNCWSAITALCNTAAISDFTSMILSDFSNSCFKVYMAIITDLFRSSNSTAYPLMLATSGNNSFCFSRTFLDAWNWSYIILSDRIIYWWRISIYCNNCTLDSIKFKKVQIHVLVG